MDLQRLLNEIENQLSHLSVPVDGAPLSRGLILCMVEYPREHRSRKKPYVVAMYVKVSQTGVATEMCTR